MEEINCILCGDGNGPVVIEENGYQGKSCPGCRLIFVSPRPSPSEIANLYAHDEAHQPASNHFHRGLEQRLHARYVLGLMRRHLAASTAPGSLLEIGPGAGYFLDEARQAGFDVSAIELSSDLARFVSDRLRIACEGDPLSEASFGDRRFDVIYHCDVISHMHDPIEAFETTREKLSPDGLVVFETGNLADVSETALERIEVFQYPDHLFFFGAKALRTLLEQTGFEVVEIRHHDLRPQALLQRMMQAVQGRASGAGPATQVNAGRRDELPSELDAFDQGTGPKRWLRSLLQQSSFGLRYRLGGWFPDVGQPQTLIVIGRRR